MHDFKAFKRVLEKKKEAISSSWEKIKKPFKSNEVPQSDFILTNRSSSEFFQGQENNDSLQEQSTSNVRLKK